MRSAMHQSLKITLASVTLMVASWACAQDLELLVKHTAVVSGADGIKRSTEYAERVSRNKDNVWVSRVLQAKAHSDHDHAKGAKAHKHLDVSTASRWISKDAVGNAQISLVPNEQKVLVIVSKSDWENVGFDGSWDAAWGLIDPTSFKRMKASTETGNLTTYTLAEKGRNVKIVWNTTLRIPVLVESSDASARRQTSVQVLQVAAVRPWDRLRNFEKKDYSDYLD
jgi:hypothetical protein